MGKSLIRNSFSLIFIISISASSQNLSLGVTGGGVLSTFYDDVYASHDSYYQRTINPRGGFDAGISARLRLNKWFHLSSSLLFITKGGSATTPDNRNINDYAINSNYISIPILTVFKPIKWLNLEIGPQIGFLTNYSSEYLNSYRKQLAINSPLYNQMLLNSRIEFSAIAGISFDITKNLNIGLHYSYAFNCNIGVPLVDGGGTRFAFENVYNRYFH